MTLVFWAKLGLSLALSAAVALALFFRHPLERRATGHENRWFWGSVALLRVLPFLLLYVVLGVRAQSDVWMFYVNAVCAREGYFVYRDFENAYAVLFPYLMMVPTWLWDSPNAVLALLLATEIGVLWYGYRYFSERLGQNQWFAALLYLLLPASFVLSILGGQEDHWLWGFTLAILILARRPDAAFSQGIAAGLALLASKALFVLLIPALLILVKNRLRFIAGMVLVGLPVLMVLLKFSGLALFQPIQQAADPRTPNLWSVLNPFLNVYRTPGVGVLNWIGLVTLLGISVGGAGWLRSRVSFEKALLFLFLLTYVWLMVIQQSSLANYAYTYLMPVTFALIDWRRRREVLFFLIFNVLVVIQPALWYGLKMPLYRLGELSRPVNLLEYALEVGLVAMLLVGFFRLIRSVRAREF